MDNLLVGNSAFYQRLHFLFTHMHKRLEDMHTYVTKFQWEGAKYPLKQSLKMLSEIIGKVSEAKRHARRRDLQT